jgi:hypothetical protein
LWGGQIDAPLQDLEPFCGQGTENSSAIKSHSSCTDHIVLSNTPFFHGLLGEAVSDGEETRSRQALRQQWTLD